MKTAIKLFGTSILDGGRASVAVCPVMIDASHPLYSVNDVFNAVMVKGNMVGTVMFYGSGAGKLPTASAWWRTSWRSPLTLTAISPSAGRRKSFL